MYIMGIDPTRVTTKSEFGLGTLGANTTTAGTKVYMYVQDSGAGITGDAYVVDIDGSAFTAVMSTTTTTAPGTGAGKAIGVARAAFTASQYGWVQIYGAGTVRVLASAAAYTILNSTATAGALDDDATASSEVISGVVLDVANAASTGNVAAFLNYPKVDRTL